MSGEVNNGGLSRAQAQSLTGQILKKLDAADGEQDGKIKGSIWNKFFNGDGGDTAGVQPGRNDGVDIEDDEISLSAVFDKLMTRIFNAARRAVGASNFHDSDGNLTTEGKSKINKVANEWFEAAGNIESEEVDDGAVEQEVAVDPTIKAANEAATNAKNSITELDSKYEEIEGLIRNAAVTDGKSKEDVEEAKSQIQQKIEELKNQIAAQKGIITQQKESIKDKTEDEGYDNANALITDAETAIHGAEEKIAQLQEALDKISTEGLKTREQLRIEKREAVINDILTTRKGKLEDKRLINGKEENYYKFKDEDGKTHRVIVDENGNLDELIEISGGALRKKQFITASKLKAETGLDSLPEGIKCKCDADGKLTFTKNGKEVVYDKTAGEFKPVQAEEE